MPLKEINIQSIQPKYDVIEDRIRLLLNHKQEGNRIDFMMTRKFLLHLLPNFDEYMLKAYPEQTHTKLTDKILKRKNDWLNNHNDLKPYQYNAELIESVQFSFIEKKKITLLSFSSTETKATLSLNSQGLSEVFAILKTAIPYYEWGISHNL